jgi:hypothetical protein
MRRRSFEPGSNNEREKINWKLKRSLSSRKAAQKGENFLLEGRELSGKTKTFACCFLKSLLKVQTDYRTISVFSFNTALFISAFDLSHRVKFFF